MAGFGGSSESDNYETARDGTRQSLIRLIVTTRLCLVTSLRTRRAHAAWFLVRYGTLSAVKPLLAHIRRPFCDGSGMGFEIRLDESVAFCSRTEFYGLASYQDLLKILHPIQGMLPVSPCVYCGNSKWISREKLSGQIPQVLQYSISITNRHALRTTFQDRSDTPWSSVGLPDHDSIANVLIKSMSQACGKLGRTSPG